MAQTISVDVAQVASNTASSITTFLLWFFIIAAVIGLLLFILWYSSYNVRVRLRFRTSTSDLIRDVKGKIIKGRDGIERLFYIDKAFKIKRVPPPPPDAVSLNEKGKRFVELEMSDEGGTRYIIKDREDHRFHPFSSNDRMFYINELKKAEERKKKTLGELVLMLTPFVVLLIILAMVFGFWDQITEPSIRAMNTMNSITANQAEITESLKEIIKHEQIIREESGEEPPE